MPASEKKPSIAAGIALIAAAIAIAVPLIGYGEQKAQICANTEHRKAWSTIDPQTIRAMPERLAEMVTQLDLLMDHFGLQPKPEKKE